MTKHYDSHDAGPEWGTPEWIWKPLADSLGGFDLDPASGAEAAPIADTRFTVKDDGLAQDWFGDVWLNPPYGREFNRKWASKVGEEWQAGNPDTMTVLVPASMETDWFQGTYIHADYLTFLDKRVSFIGAGDTSASFPSVICSIGEFPVEYHDALSILGHTLINPI